jgi:predicted ATP-binding protein involved in virulence
LYDTTERIINSCITDGKFIGVSRKTLTPLFNQFGSDIGIDKLSSGSIYIMQRMLSLLTKAYAAHVLNNTPIDKILEVEGMLLIDEAETHLHPKWQKILFKNILSIFPNIQIIATTHSPFIVSSLPGAEVIVCKTGRDGCFLENETENYANKPVEEILRMPLFDTDSFNAEISDLLKKRKEAIDKDNERIKIEIERKLEDLNPEYFKYLKIGYL